MRFAITSLMLLASLGSVLSQGTTSSSTTAAAPASTSSSSTSSSSSSAAAAAGGSATSAAAATATCSLVSGDPKAQPFGCVPGATTITPPYNSESLLSFQIAKYTPGKEGKSVSSVASNMADTVTGLYPTLTVSYGAIVSQYASELNRVAYGDGVMGGYNVPTGLITVAALAVAIVAGGAVAL